MTTNIGSILSERSTIKVVPNIGKLQDISGNNIGFQISSAGGSINLASGKTDNAGFYVAVVGTEGILKVKLWGGDNTAVELPFFYGWNPVLIKEVVVDGANTAVDVYWGK